jgi:hypothetical protein
MGDIVLKLLSHITTPLFVGPPLCDDPEFLHLNCVFVGEVFMTAILMRQFPSFMHPVITRCLPSYWRLLKMKRKIANYLIPVIQERQRSQQANPNVEKRKDVLQYMIDMAQTEKETDPSNMAVRYIFTIIGSVHSVVAAATDTIYELIERPEYIQPLLEEVDQALEETGGEWGKDFASRLMKMDSFMKETQRVKPTTPREFYQSLLDPKAPFKLIPPQSVIVASSRSLSPLLMACISRKVHSLAYPACHSQSRKCLSTDYGTTKRASIQAKLSVSSRLLMRTMPNSGLEGMLARAGIWPPCRSNS